MIGGKICQASEHRWDHRIACKCVADVDKITGLEHELPHTEVSWCRAPERCWVRDGEPPSMVSCGRHGLGHGWVDTDIISTDEGTVESVELKLEGVDDVEDKVDRSERRWCSRSCLVYVVVTLCETASTLIFFFSLSAKEIGGGPWRVPIRFKHSLQFWLIFVSGTALLWLLSLHDAIGWTRRPMDRRTRCTERMYLVEIRFNKN
jgi:hypothetical protein